MKAKKPDPEPAGELPAITACPSCGRRPSERVALCWRPEYEGPTTTACNDNTHDQADRGPAYDVALRKLAMLSLGDDPDECEILEQVARLRGDE